MLPKIGSQLIGWSIAWLIASCTTAFGAFVLRVGSYSGHALVLLSIPGLAFAFLGVSMLLGCGVWAKRSSTINAEWSIPFAAFVWIACGTACLFAPIPGLNTTTRHEGVGYSITTGAPDTLLWERSSLSPVFRDGRLIEVRYSGNDNFPTFPPGLLRPHTDTLELIEAPRQAPFDMPHIYYGMTKLRELTLDESGMDRENFQMLERLQNLEVLNMRKVLVVDDFSMRCIAEIPNLRELDFSSSPTESKLFRRIASSKHLKILRLNKTLISDEGLVPFAEIPTLQRIEVRDTRVTQRGVDAFLRARPEVEVSHGAERESQF